MLPGQFPLALYRGDSQRWKFVLWADAEKTEPADLTDVVAKAQIRDKPSGSKVTEIVCQISGNVIDAILSAEAARTIPAKGAWDLELTYPSGEVATILAGAVQCTGDITESTP